eukprot:88105_1
MAAIKFKSQGKMKIRIDSKTQKYLDTQVRNLMRFISSLNGNTDYHVIRTEPLRIVDEATFVAMPLLERVKYLEEYVCTAGRKVASLKAVHWVDLHRDDDTKQFDFSIHNITRRDLITAGSYHTNMKNLSNALNRLERDRNQKAIKRTNKLPSNRKDNEFIVFGCGSPYTADIELSIIKVKEFLTQYAVKKASRRGNKAKGFEPEDYANVSKQAPENYKTIAIYHTPIYLLGLCIYKMLPLFHQRGSEFELLRFGAEVVRTSNWYHFIRPKGIKNNRVDIIEKIPKNKDIYIYPSSNGDTGAFELLEMIYAWRPKDVTDNALFPLPRDKFLHNESLLMNGDTIAFYADTKVKNADMLRAVKLVIESCNFVWNGTLNDFKYTAIDLMYKAGMSVAQMQQRSSHTSNATDCYINQVCRQEDHNDTQAIIEAQIDSMAQPIVSPVQPPLLLPSLNKLFDPKVMENAFTCPTTVQMPFLEPQIGLPPRGKPQMNMNVGRVNVTPIAIDIKREIVKAKANEKEEMDEMDYDSDVVITGVFVPVKPRPKSNVKTETLGISQADLMRMIHESMRSYFNQNHNVKSE